MTAEELNTKLGCSQCHKEFKYESERRRHELSHSPQFECDVCSKKFSFISALRRHEKQHGRTGSVDCKQCGGKFRDEILLKRHVNYAHKGTFNCKKCSSSFNSEVALQTHAKTHKPQAERLLRCSFNGCNKSFNFPHHLKHHELAHTNAKQHFCNICGKGFIQLHHLKTHFKSHDPENWLTCEVSNCDKKFSNEYAFKRHLATHKNKHDKFNNYKIKSSQNASVKLKNRVKDAVRDKRKYVNSILKSDINKDDSSNSLKSISNKTESKFSSNSNDMEFFTDCETVLGSCLVNDSGGNDCLCTQMTHNENEPYDLTPIEKKYNKYNTLQINNKIQIKQNSCAECECTSKCRDTVYKNVWDAPNKDSIFPNIEYSDNGIVKLRDTFDLDISKVVVSNEDEYYSESEMKPEIYNSCKDILGKCIVSGNGTISENCLCAKMHFDEQQVLAEEVQDIIPQPKDPNLGGFAV